MGLPEVTIYTDGSCLDNPGDGGWGAVLLYNGTRKEFSGFIPKTTSNRAELTAMIEAVRYLEEPCKVLIRSDSQMTVRCINREYKRKANRDLWTQFEALERLHNIRVEWLKGHAGIPENERAHELAENAARRGTATDLVE